MLIEVTDDENELLSVVMCTYNGIKFIEPQLSTIQNQSYANLEIIIVDDASTDGTYEWLQAAARNDNRIRLFRNTTNAGANINFNIACTYATGKYIAIADQDDIWELDKLSVLHTAIKKQKGTVLAHSISVRFKKEPGSLLNKNKRANYFSGNDPRQFFITNAISGHNMLFKKDLIGASIPFPNEVYYDWWLVINACCVGSIQAVEKVLVWQRIHGNNLTEGAKPLLLYHKVIQTSLPYFLSIKNLPETYKAFGEKLLTLYKELPRKKFSFRLFVFLLKNATALFANKKRKIPFLSNIIRAFKLARANKTA